MKKKKIKQLNLLANVMKHKAKLEQELNETNAIIDKLSKYIKLKR